MKYEIMLPSYMATRTLFKMRELDGAHGTGFTRVEDGTELVYCRVEYSPEELRRLCARAAGNKNNIAVDGPLRAVVVSRKRV
jgi:hypothetical protein